jgi:serine/threonine-protein kinase
VSTRHRAAPLPRFAEGGNGPPSLLTRSARLGVARDGSSLRHGVAGRADLHSLVEYYWSQPPSAAHILIQLVTAGQRHAAGLIHRDIKPANLYLCRYGLDTDFVKVLDFGLVKPRESEAEPRPDLKITQHQTITGTPGFIAPEAMGEGPLDGRADLYALGCVAYWMLTGREVFEQAALMAMLVAHAQQTPRPPSDLVPEVPRDLERVG